MTWECQGRQEHGWFGHGTCDGDGNIGAIYPMTVTDVAYTALSYLPTPQRKRYEGWLQNGGLKQLASALPGWAAVSGLPRKKFRELYFGEHSDAVVAAHAQNAGAELNSGSPRGDVRVARVAAGLSLAEMVQAVHPESMGRVMAAAAQRAIALPTAKPNPGHAVAPIAYTDTTGGVPLVLKDGTRVLDARGVPILVPPGVDIYKNIQVGRSISGMPSWRKNAIMLNLFLPGAAMDYQRNNGANPPQISPFAEVNRSYIQFGNYNFGAVAAAAGYSLEEALRRAGQANVLGGDRSGPYGTNPATYHSIVDGWNAAKQMLLTRE